MSLFKAEMLLADPDYSFDTLPLVASFLWNLDGTRLSLCDAVVDTSNRECLAIFWALVTIVRVDIANLHTWMFHSYFINQGNECNGIVRIGWI